MEEERNNKRPCSGSDDEERTTSRPRVDGGDDRTVTEEEVEEFYSILRRMHEASTGFAFRNGDGRGGRRGRRAATWVPAFKLEDFEEADALKDVNGTETPTNEAETVGGEGRRPSAVAGDGDDVPGCLDLNTEPDSRGLAHVKPEQGGGSAELSS